uniref:Nucleoside diphosphate kinase n=2 Tax=Lygus hesperus TaxID=30085 RepID=A0A0A9YZ79_LYGHE
MKSVCFAFAVFLLFGFICCEDEPCVEAEGCYIDTVEPKWVHEMNDAFAKKGLDVKVKEIVHITRREKGDSQEVHTKAQILAEDGRTCFVTWVETSQHADDWIPDMKIDCENTSETNNQQSTVVLQSE